MKFLAFLFKRILYPACAFFAVIWLILCLILDSALELVNINFGSSVLCFVIGIALACCNLVLTCRKIPYVARYFAHMGLSVLSISIIVAIFSAILETGYAITGRSLYLVLLLVLAYLIIATPALIVYNHFFLSKNEKNEDKETQYTSIFKKG